MPGRDHGGAQARARNTTASGYLRQYLLCFLSSWKISAQLQGPLQSAFGQIGVTRFVVGHPQMVMDHGIVSQFLGAFFEERDGLPVEVLFIVEPAQSVRDRWVVGELLSGGLRQRERSVDIPPVFGIVPCQVIGGWSKPGIELEGLFVIHHGLLGLVLEIM
jgi:hypothetical protein